MSELRVAVDARLVGGTNTGDSTYWTGLLYGMSRIEPNARILLISNAEKPPKIPWCDAFEWVVATAPTSRWWSLFTFPLVARRLRADVAHTQYTLSPLARNGVTTVHDVSFLLGPEWFRPKDRLILSRTVPAACRRARRVIAVSETCRSEIERLIPAARGKTEVTFNACPPCIQAVDPGEAAHLVRERFGLGGPYLLTVGTRWPRKNMDLALRAAEMLPASLPHRLVVTGKPGWGEEKLGARGLATGYVTTDELSALYSAASLYLAPSRHEGFGIPVLEAMRCGCPVLCSGGGALPEVADDAAWVERSWEPRDWAAAMESILGDSSILSRLRRRGREREAEFTWEDTATKTLEIYREVMR